MRSSCRASFAPLLVLLSASVALAAAACAKPDAEVAPVADAARERRGSQAEVQAAVDEWIRASGGEPVRVELRGADLVPNPHESCPAGKLCDGAVNYYAEGMWMRLDFRLATGTPLSAAALQSAFMVATVIYRPRSLLFADWDVRAGGDMTFRPDEGSVRFTGWSDGRVQGEIRGELRDVTGYLDGCAPHDAPTPPRCVVRGSIRVPFVLAFDLPLAA